MGWFGQHELYQWSDDNSQELASGIIKKGETLEELAEAFGFVGVAEFAEEVARYNGFVDAGRDEDFGRDPEKMVKIETGSVLWHRSVAEPAEHTGRSEAQQCHLSRGRLRG